jgi:hypothetical protein
MIKTRSLIGAFLGLVAVAWAITADAKVVLLEKGNLRGRSAMAQWSYSDATTTTFVDLFVAEGASSPVSQNPRVPLLFLTVVRQEIGGSFLIFQGFGFLEGPKLFTLKETGNMAKAEVSAFVPVRDDVTQATTTFVVNVTFTGTSQFVVERDHITDNHGGFKVNVYFDGQARSASASGSITGVGVNFTPVPSTVGFMQIIHSGFLFVTKEP